MTHSPEIQANMPPVVEIPQQPEAAIVESVGGSVVAQQPVVTQIPVEIPAMPVAATSQPIATGPSIVIPEEQSVLLQEAKGDPNNSLTGWAKWWLRKAAMAVHRNIMVIVGKNNA